MRERTYSNSDATRRSMRHVASLRLLVIGTATALLLGCWSRKQGQPPPDLSAQNAEVSETLIRLERIQGTMQGELDALERDKAEFFAEDVATWGRPFPLDAFKHAAMSCLNEPYTDAVAEPIAEAAAARLEVSCAAPAVVVFEDRLDRDSSVRGFGLEKLQQIDGIRLLRARLQERLRQLPTIVRRTRNYLASRRAEARQLRKDIERRQPEFATATYKEALERVEDYQASLDRLETAVDEVEQSVSKWSEALGAVVDSLYKDLSRLGRT